MELYNIYKDGVLSFMGPINIHVRVFFGNFIKVILQENYQTVNRLYRTFIELTQNVDYYSAETSISAEDETKTGVGSFMLKKYSDHFTFTTGNLIYAHHGEKLTEYCEEINKSDKAYLREVKRNKRRNADIKDQGAHIGLLQVAVITGNTFNYKIDKIDEQFSYFTLTVKIDKQQRKK